MQTSRYGSGSTCKGTLGWASAWAELRNSGSWSGRECSGGQSQAMGASGWKETCWTGAQTGSRYRGIIPKF